MHRIETTRGRPDLARIVADWLVAEFGYPGGRTPEQVVTRILGSPNGPEEPFVLFEQDRPVGTAGLRHDDLASRPDLTPWLAGVFMEPAARGHGYASALVRRVEAFAATAGVPTLWLYTWSAESLYARLGWQRVGPEMDRGKDVVLMTRDLSKQS